MFLSGCFRRLVPKLYIDPIHLSSSIRSLMDLKYVINQLESVAPLKLAESWDNVGLLVEPSPPYSVNRMLLTNDMTYPVLQEALATRSNLIVSYHPPIFKPMKRLSQANIKEKLILQCVENKIAVFSPHTSYDAVQDGVNDWLLSLLGPMTDVYPVVPIKLEDVVAAEISSVDPNDLSRLITHPDVTKSGQLIYFDKKLVNTLQFKPPLMQILQDKSKFVGFGRKGSLAEPTKIIALINKVKAATGLSHLRVAIGHGKNIDSLVTTVACCAGSGSSVLQGCPADVYLTGEMSHHDLLDATSVGCTVILCEHSNSERGFLHILKKRLQNILVDLDIIVSQKDEDPVTIM